MSTYRRLLWLVVAGMLLSAAASPPRQETTPTATIELPTESPTVGATSTPTPTPSVTPTLGPVTTEGAPAIPFVATWISPTPDETGAIIVIVQPNDSMWAIAARAGITLPELLALNNLTEQSIISPGDPLIVGYVTPEPTAEPTQPLPTLPPPTPRPTDAPLVAAVCLSAFDDLNRNGTHDPGEPLRAGVAFTVYNSEAVVANYVTDGRSEPRCMGGLAPGEYRVTRSVTANETLTTPGDWALNLTAGSELRQAFGSASGPPPTTAAPPPGAAPTALADAGSADAPPGQPQAAAPAETPSRDGLLTRLALVGGLFAGGLLLMGAVLILALRPTSRHTTASPSESAENERRFHKLDDLE